MSVRAALVTDGSSDRVLVRVLEWVVARHATQPIEISWADLRGLQPRPSELSDRLASAVRLYQCRLLFVHRDSEGQDPDLRYREIELTNHTGVTHVAVVPVTMQEAWLLHNETALREAAGRPSGRNALDLPSPRQWDQVADPKTILHSALRAASGTSGRRARSFRPHQAALRLADLIEDWSPLRRLAAFQRLESDTQRALHALGM